eukprot:jgi/Chrzof1/15039/Cz09g24260.t1
MHASARHRLSNVKVVATWTPPRPDKDADFIKPSYVPSPQEPFIQPYRTDPQPLYAPSAPEFAPPDTPDQNREMPEAPKMPERRPDPIPAGNPKEKPPGEPEKQVETPPAKPKE